MLNPQFVHCVVLLIWLSYQYNITVILLSPLLALDCLVSGGYANTDINLSVGHDWTLTSCNPVDVL